MKSAQAAAQFSTTFNISNKHTLPYQFNEKEIKVKQNNKKESLGCVPS